jgi:hypothetical protein
MGKTTFVKIKACEYNYTFITTNITGMMTLTSLHNIYFPVAALFFWWGTFTTKRKSSTFKHCQMQKSGVAESMTPMLLLTANTPLKLNR